MKYISYNLVNESLGIANVSIKGNKYTFEYPCTNNHECTDYEILLSPGKYTIELYGASGGHYEGYISLFQDPTKEGCIEQNVKGNVKCVKKSSMAGAGGYTRGTINIKEITRGFLSIGGSGVYGTKVQIKNQESCYSPENMMKGGYNGGASSSNYYYYHESGSGSGGGATDLRMEKNDLYHRILVAGGGGGSDNKYGTYRGSDDGSGGAGGGLEAQGYFISGVYDGTRIANQTFGFSFGTGQAPRYSSGSSDRAGAGGGWFGGFASNDPNGGAGGGSSFALTKNFEISKEKIIALNEFGIININSSDYYAFNSSSSYIFRSVLMNAGVWDGNGLAVITYKTPMCTYAHWKSKINHMFIYLMIISIKC